MSNLFFPINTGKVEWNTEIRQGWDVQESKSASGRRRTLCQQVLPAWEFDLSFKHLTKTERDTLLGFYAQCKGSLKGFFYKDYEHHRCDNQALAKGTDGKYQCIIPIGAYNESAEYVDNLTVYINGTQTTNYTVVGGKITYSGTGTLTASYDYYWKVCFADSITISEAFANLYNVSLKLKVVRE